MDDRKPGRERDAGDGGEQALFEQEMLGIRRVAAKQPVPAQRAPRARSAAEHDRDTMAELEALVAGEGDLLLSDSDDLVEAALPGIDRRTLRRLRRGEYAVQAHLDLHGCGAEQARTLVEHFVCDAHARGLRCVRIVHGRGRNSPGGVAVLKQKLPRWLARGPARRLVLAYTTAPPCDGGSGATYVLVRRNGGRPTPP